MNKEIVTFTKEVKVNIGGECINHLVKLEFNVYDVFTKENIPILNISPIEPSLLYKEFIGNNRDYKESSINSNFTFEQRGIPNTEKEYRAFYDNFIKHLGWIGEELVRREYIKMRHVIDKHLEGLETEKEVLKLKELIIKSSDR